MTAVPFSPYAPTVPELGYVELAPDDDLAIRVNAFVRYTHRGYDSFYGSVVSIDEAGRVEVLADGDAEACWCAADRLVLILAASAAAVGADGRMG